MLHPIPLVAVHKKGRFKAWRMVNCGKIQRVKLEDFP